MSRTIPAVTGIGVASLGLLAAAWAWRGPHAPLEAIPRAAALSAPLPRPAPDPAPCPKGDEEFWNTVANPAEREVILRWTEDFLGLSPEEARAFRSAALSAVENVDRAWEVREAGWIAVSSSAASDPQLLARLEEEIQFRYESEKERALQRLAARLGGGERSERLRERLEEWIDAVR